MTFIYYVRIYKRISRHRLVFKFVFKLVFLGSLIEPKIGVWFFKIMSSLFVLWDPKKRLLYESAFIGTAHKFAWNSGQHVETI